MNVEEIAVTSETWGRVLAEAQISLILTLLTTDNKKRPFGEWQLEFKIEGSGPT